MTGAHICPHCHKKYKTLAGLKKHFNKNRECYCKAGYVARRNNWDVGAFLEYFGTAFSL